jgi:hypothetical protein
MMKGLAVLSGLLLVTLPRVASAQERCEGGEWFCDEPAEAPDNTGNNDDTQFDAGESNQAPAASDKPKDDAASAEPHPKIHVEAEAPPPPRRHWRRREWGLNLHLMGALMGDHPGKSPNAAMSGAGLELRYRTVPHFAFVAGGEFLGGTDWNGNRRSETGLLLGGMVFFNPASRFQLYMPMGIGFSSARVTMAATDQMLEEHETRYSYFGAYAGFGAELRIARRIALNLDIIGFVRTRTDVREGDAPEYTDPNTGLTTNSSGGGLVRGGLTFYW